MLERRAQELDSHPVKIGNTDRFYAFLPVKSGVGTATIAANLTWALGNAIPAAPRPGSQQTDQQPDRVRTPELHGHQCRPARHVRRIGLESKTTLLVNRFSKRAELTLEQIEETVGLPVYASFGCEYDDVMKATREARPSAKLAHSFAKMAAKLVDKKVPESPRARFIERFAVLPTRYSFR